MKGRDFDGEILFGPPADRDIWKSEKGFQVRVGHHGDLEVRMEPSRPKGDSLVLANKSIPDGEEGMRSPEVT